MPRVPTCIIWFLSRALLSLLSFLKLFIATKPSWYEDSEIMVDDLPSLLQMIYFPSSLLPGPNYYSNNSRRQPPLPLAHWHTGKIPHCCWAQAASCFPGLQGCHRDYALQSHSAALASSSSTAQHLQRVLPAGSGTALQEISTWPRLAAPVAWHTGGAPNMEKPSRSAPRTN